MLKSLFGPRKLVFDPALGDPLAARILKEAQQGKVNTLLKEVDCLREGEWDRRAFYLDRAGKYLSTPEIIDDLPDTPIANLLRGSVGIILAWKARGGGMGEDVPEDAAQIFFQNLEYAAPQFLRAADQDSKDPTPFAFLQTVAMGLELERETADDWFAEAVRRDPFNQQAHFRHLTFITKKWFGSHEEMYDFARATMAKTPPGSTLSSIMFLAFQEHFLYLMAFDKDMPAANVLINDPAVIEESRAVYHSSLAKRKSIDRVSDYWPHNLAVWWFMAIGQKEIVRAETKKVGVHFTEYPWKVFFNDMAEGYQRALNT